MIVDLRHDCGCKVRVFRDDKRVVSVEFREVCKEHKKKGLTGVAIQSLRALDEKKVKKK